MCYTRYEEASCSGTGSFVAPVWSDVMLSLVKAWIITIPEGIETKCSLCWNILSLSSLLYLSYFLKALHIWWQSKVCLSLCLCYKSIFGCDSVVLCCGCFWWCCSIHDVILFPLSPSFYCPKKTVTNKACFFPEMCCPGETVATVGSIRRSL